MYRLCQKPSEWSRDYLQIMISLEQTQWWASSRYFSLAAASFQNCTASSAGVDEGLEGSLKEKEWSPAKLFVALTEVRITGGGLYWGEKKETAYSCLPCDGLERLKKRWKVGLYMQSSEVRETDPDCLSHWAVVDGNGWLSDTLDIWDTKYHLKP